MYLFMKVACKYAACFDPTLQLGLTVEFHFSTFSLIQCTYTVYNIISTHLKCFGDFLPEPTLCPCGCLISKMYDLIWKTRDSTEYMYMLFRQGIKS